MNALRNAANKSGHNCLDGHDIGPQSTSLVARRTVKICDFVLVVRCTLCWRIEGEALRGRPTVARRSHRYEVVEGPGAVIAEALSLTAEVRRCPAGVHALCARVLQPMCFRRSEDVLRYFHSVLDVQPVWPAVRPLTWSYGPVRAIFPRDRLPPSTWEFPGVPVEVCTRCALRELVGSTADLRVEGHGVRTRASCASWWWV